MQALHNRLPHDFEADQAQVLVQGALVPEKGSLKESAQLVSRAVRDVVLRDREREVEEDEVVSAFRHFDKLLALLVVN